MARTQNFEFECPSTFEQNATFTVTITSDIDSPTGKVRFGGGTKTIGIATVDENGNATFTKKNLAVGSHAITAEYYGDSLSAKTMPEVLTQEVLTQVVSSDASTIGSVSVR
jgi:Bacterial Ig-like domain (group 3)